jgi:hypothetical protein
MPDLPSHCKLHQHCAGILTCSTKAVSLIVVMVETEIECGGFGNFEATLDRTCYDGLYTVRSRVP